MMDTQEWQEIVKMFNQLGEELTKRSPRVVVVFDQIAEALAAFPPQPVWPAEVQDAHRQIAAYVEGKGIAPSDA